jgi:hypothetical protein
MAHDVFICHSSKDRTIANAICSTLEQHRIRCWIAPRDVIPGSDYAQSIVEAISTARLTVLVFSDSSNHSPHVRREIERSVSHGIPILPFRVEDVVPSPSLEYFISDAHWLDAMTPPLEQHLGHLAETVRLLLDRQPGARPPTPSQAEPPAVEPEPAPEPARSRRMLWFALGAAVLLVAVVAGLMVFRSRGEVPSAAPRTGSTAAGTAGGATPSATTPAAASTDMFLDDFEKALAPGWIWVHEDSQGWSLDAIPGSLQITAQKSPPLRNVLLRDAAWAGKEYSFSATMRFTPTSSSQFAGLVITGSNPDSDRIEFGRGFCEGTGCVGDGLYLYGFKDGAVGSDSLAFRLPAGVKTVELSLDVTATEISAWYSLDDGESWEELGTHAFVPGYTRVGLAARAPTAITASFEDFAIFPP